MCARLVGVCVLKPDVSCIQKDRPMYDTKEFCTQLSIQFYFDVSGLIRKNIIFIQISRYHRARSHSPGPESFQTIWPAREELLNIRQRHGIPIGITKSQKSPRG